MKRLLLVLAVLALCQGFTTIGLAGEAANSAITTEQPSEIGVFYHIDPDTGGIVALERQTAVIRNKLKTRGFRGRTIKTKITSWSSSVRFSGPPKFVVRLAPGTDPNKYKLYRYTIRKHRREVVLVSGGTASPARDHLPDYETGRITFCIHRPGGTGTRRVRVQSDGLQRYIQLWDKYEVKNGTDS